MSPPIVTDGAMMAPERGIHELGAGFGASIGATASEAWADSPLSQLMTGSEIMHASGEAPDFGKINDNTIGGVDITEEVKPAVPGLDMIDAIDRVKKAGLDKHLTLPNQPDMPQAQLEIMMRNARARAEREATVERGPQGFIPSALQVGTSFLVGAADPINLASAFIPIMGELRYGKMLAAAGDSVSARLATRAAVGAGQGAVGQAALEPLDWWAHTQEGRDFGMSDVLHNIMFGAALGGAMHAGGGFISDAYRKRQGRALYPFGPGEVLARVPDVQRATEAPAAVEAPFRPIERGEPVRPDSELDAAVSRIEGRDADFRTLDAEYRSARLTADESKALWQSAVDRFGKDSPEALALEEAHLVDHGRAANLERQLDELEARAPSPEVETINDLPPRAHEDAMRVAISDLINGEPVRAGDVIAAAARTDARIAESMEAPRKVHAAPQAPDPLDLAMKGELDAARAQQIADELKRQQREVEDVIFKGRADEWRKLQRQSDRAWDNARDAEARALDERIEKLEKEVGLTKADEDWLDGRGWDEFSVAENWDDLARSLDNIAFGREDAIAEAAAAVRYLPKTRDWTKMGTRERQAVLTMLSAMNEEKKAGRDPKDFLRDAFQERIRRYGGNADAHEVVGYQMQELADLLSGPLERSAPEEPKPVQPTGPKLLAAPTVGADLDKAADWRAVSAQRPDFNDPDVIAASNAAAKVEPPPAELDKRVSAAEKADAYAQKLYDMFAHRLPPEERARLEEAIATLDRQKADLDVVTERGAACLFEARGG